MKLIVGLGNIGTEYDKTRHNVGFAAVDHLIEVWRFPPFKENRAFKAMISESSHENEKILIVKPLTFMNNSGDAVELIRNFYKINRADIIAIYDDIDLPVGTIRMRKEGSAGTHNGMRSLCAAIGNDFPRIRIGIDGRTPEQKTHMELADYVLGRFTKEEERVVAELIKKIPGEVDQLLKN